MDDGKEATEHAVREETAVEDDDWDQDGNPGAWEDDADDGNEDDSNTECEPVVTTLVAPKQPKGPEPARLTRWRAQWLAENAFKAALVRQPTMLMNADGIRLVVPFLGDRDLMTFAHVCRRWNRVIKDTPACSQRVIRLREVEFHQWMQRRNSQTRIAFATRRGKPLSEDAIVRMVERASLYDC